MIIAIIFFLITYYLRFEFCIRSNNKINYAIQLQKKKPLIIRQQK